MLTNSSEIVQKGVLQRRVNCASGPGRLKGNYWVVCSGSVVLPQQSLWKFCFWQLLPWQFPWWAAIVRLVEQSYYEESCFAGQHLPPSCLTARLLAALASDSIMVLLMTDSRFRFEKSSSVGWYSRTNRAKAFFRLWCLWSYNLFFPSCTLATIFGFSHLGPREFSCTEIWTRCTISLKDNSHHAKECIRLYCVFEDLAQYHCCALRSFPHLSRGSSTQPPQLHLRTSVVIVPVLISWQGTRSSLQGNSRHINEHFLRFCVRSRSCIFALSILIGLVPHLTIFHALMSVIFWVFRAPCSRCLGWLFECPIEDLH